MTRIRELFHRFRESDGRAKAKTATGVLGLAVVVALALGVLPALAGEGPNSQRLIEPQLVSYGGGPGACAQFGSPTARYELHINNPMSGVFPGPAGTSVELRVYDSDTKFDYWFLKADGSRVSETGPADPAVNGAYDVIVNGGPKNTWYNNDGAGTVLQWDKGLHAPTKGSGLHKLSHINICFDEMPTEFVCGTEVPRSGVGTFTESVATIFGNNEQSCSPKQGFYTITNSGTPNVRLDFNVSGSGTNVVAGRIDVTKNFATLAFVPLQYTRMPTDTPKDVPWCKLRDKVTSGSNQDGPHFDLLVPAGKYPTNNGVASPFGGTGDAIVCKVVETEDASGKQITKMYFEVIDPQFR